MHYVFFEFFFVQLYLCKLPTLLKEMTSATNNIAHLSMSTPFCYCFIKHQYSHMLYYCYINYPYLIDDQFRDII